MTTRKENITKRRFPKKNQNMFRRRYFEEFEKESPKRDPEKRDFEKVTPKKKVL